MLNVAGGQRRDDVTAAALVAGRHPRLHPHLHHRGGRLREPNLTGDPVRVSGEAENASGSQDPAGWTGKPPAFLWHNTSSYSATFASTQLPRAVNWLFS